MAISETMSNRSEWMQFYPTNFSNATQTHPTAAASSSSVTSKDINNNNLRLDHGRISKPLRRRSRASRRTPTTLFNTDTTNFRAMVQKFTGGYVSPLTTSRYDQLPSGGGATLGFNVFGTQQLGGVAAATMAPAASGFHMQYSNQLQQQNMFMISNMQGRGGGTGVSSHAPPAGSSFKSDGRVYNDNYMIG